MQITLHLAPLGRGCSDPYSGRGGTLTRCCSKLVFSSHCISHENFVCMKVTLKNVREIVLTVSSKSCTPQGSSLCRPSLFTCQRSQRRQGPSLTLLDTVIVECLKINTCSPLGAPSLVDTRSDKGVQRAGNTCLHYQGQRRRHNTCRAHTHTCGEENVQKSCVKVARFYRK